MPTNALQPSLYHKTTEQIAEEQRLIRAAQADIRQFSLLYNRYYKQIFLFVYKRVSDESETADLTAQVFLKAMQSLPRYEFKGLPFSSWLYRIAVNEVNQFFRSSKKHQYISLDTEGMRHLAEDEDEPFDESVIGRMKEAVAKLEPDDVQMIQLRYFDKIPFKDVADIFGISENNAKVRMFRILQKLKKLMGNVAFAE